MAITYRRINQSHSEVVAHLAEMLEGNREFYQGIRLRCVALEQDGIWSSALCSIRGIRVGDPRERLKGRDYGGIRLLEEWIAPRALLSRLGQVERGSVTICEQDVTLGDHCQLRDIQFLAANSDYATEPGYLYSGSSSHRPSTSHDPLVAYRQPVYSDMVAAIREWGEFHRFHDFSDARIGSLLIFLPESRARLEEITFSDGRLVVGLALADASLSDLRLQGTYSLGGRTTPIDRPVADPSVVIDIGEPPDHFEVYLVGPDDTLFDYHKETPYLIWGRRRTFRAIGLSGPLANLVEQGIRNGEGETIEFKPYIRPRDPKERELVKTAIAFANTRGGSILVGINDQCEVDGVERSMARRSRGSLDRALKQYVGHLRQVLRGRANRDIRLEIDAAQYANHTVIVIRVPEGEQKPYFDLASQEIYVRRGANNVRPDPEKELPALLRRTLDSNLGF